MKKQQSTQQKLYQAISLLDGQPEITRFFTDLCTPAELQAMTDRWRVVPLIKQGLPYRKIYELTGVSVTTVGRVARTLSYGDNGYDIIYQRQQESDNAA